MDTVSLNSSISLNEVINKKTRGRPKLTEEEKKKRKEEEEEYKKTYREQNKDKIANYESRKYNESNSEIIKKRNSDYIKKYIQIVNVIKYLYFNGLLDINDTIKENELKILLENCKKN